MRNGRKKLIHEITVYEPFFPEKDIDVDGVLFQSTFACKNLAPVLNIFKEKARQMGIPVVETSFNNVGENVEQNRTRIEAFMEMIRA